jgi:DNA-binding transcriptional LysR family regulator
MATRTLVAYERDDGFDLHYAHDGVDPAALTPATPFGGPSERDLAALRDRLEPLGIELDDPPAGTAVDPVPLATGHGWDRVVTDLDYAAYDRCLRVSADWTVDRYLVCHFGLADRLGRADGTDPVGDGALLPVGAGEAEYATGWFEGAKSAVADGVGCGLFGTDAARSYLAGRVRAFAGEATAYVGF